MLEILQANHRLKCRSGWRRQGRAILASRGRGKTRMQGWPCERGATKPSAGRARLTTGVNLVGVSRACPHIALGSRNESNMRTVPGRLRCKRPKASLHPACVLGWGAPIGRPCRGEGLGQSVSPAPATLRKHCRPSEIERSSFSPQPANQDRAQRDPGWHSPGGCEADPSPRPAKPDRGPPPNSAARGNQHRV